MVNMRLYFRTYLHITHYREMQLVLDEGTEPWGVYVERVEVKDVRVPEQLQRAMAAEAEAAREARAKVIAAEGEHKASRALRHAAEVITDCPAALQVRQVLNQASIKHFIIIFRIPKYLLHFFRASYFSHAIFVSMSCV